MVFSVVKVTDPRGVQWSVRRAPIPDLSNSGADDEWVLAIWPFWFIAHWLGLPWMIVIHRDGNGVAEEKVRGWHKSRRRIQEIAEMAAAGTLQQKIGADSPPEK